MTRADLARRRGAGRRRRQLVGVDQAHLQERLRRRARRLPVIRRTQHEDRQEQQVHQRRAE
jgi:hypothetical protein